MMFICHRVGGERTSGFVDKKTGKFMPYDHDEDGLLDMHDFIRFFSGLGDGEPLEIQKDMLPKVDPEVKEKVDR